MEDYHVFSSSNLTDWTDHGIIVSQYDVDWVNPDSYSMWAPDCIERNGKYYFYFPSNSRNTSLARGFTNIHHLVVVLETGKPVEVDWIRFLNDDP